MPRPARKPAVATRASQRKPKTVSEPEPSKRPIQDVSDQLNISPDRQSPAAQSPRSPAASSPRYGRRSAAHRRMSFTPVAQRTRRTSGGPEFNELIDGLSPIKRGGPAESEMVLELNDQNEIDELPIPQDVLAEEKRPRTRASTVAATKDTRPEPSAKKESDVESESDDFDIDALVKSSKRVASKRTAAQPKKALADSTTDTGLPRRHRTQKSETLTKTKGKGRSARGRASRASAIVDDATSSEGEAETKPKKKKSRVRKPTAASKESGDIWAADSGVAHYFDDIDGFKLAEEQV
ncbi:hypothetical protein IW148_000638 [Coemansia sp. RSA 1199]|nr:hypothetical protein IW148_000638 [Coemansia sp. RSA 1199]